MTNPHAGFEQFALALANAHKVSSEKYNKELDIHQQRIKDDPDFKAGNPFNWIVRRAQIETIGAMVSIAKDTVDRLKSIDLAKSA